MAIQWTFWEMLTLSDIARTLEVVARDPAIDGLLAILTPQAMTDPTAIAQALAVGQSKRQTDLGQLDGRRNRRTWRTNSRPSWYRHVCLSRHCSTNVYRHVAVVL